MKRVLIITYYWPPAGGPGVQRWLKFVKYFRDFDIDPVVYIPENPHYPITDDDFVSEIPGDIEIVKRPIKEPYGFARIFSKKKTKQMSSGIISGRKQSFIEKLMLFVRGNFFIPDARVSWVKPSVSFFKTYLIENNIDTIVTTGPPHSLHLIGLQLKREMDVKWLADFRDPWTTIHYHKSLRLTAASERKHKMLESEVLNTADTIVVTSPSTKLEFEAITIKPIMVITNGYDMKPELPAAIDSKFSLAHIGSLLSDRNPKILWKVLSEIASEIPTFLDDLEIRLAGAVSEDVLESIAAFRLKEYTVYSGYVAHREALQLQSRSQILLLIEMDRPETRAIIPGKLFEYLAAKRPIIALGPEGSDIKNILEETKSGEFFNYRDEIALKDKLLNCYKDFKEGELDISSEGIERYSRRELTRVMAELLLK